MEKELAFAFIDKAPESVLKAADAHRQNFFRLQKAESQLALWQAELTEAKNAHGGTLKSLQIQIEKWQSTDLTLSTIQDLIQDVEAVRK